MVSAFGIAISALKGRSKAVNTMDEAVRDWYMRRFPTDELGDEIDETITFRETVRRMLDGDEFYGVIGVGDSVVRERLFDEIAARIGCDYGDVYDAWLDRGDARSRLASLL